MVDAVWSWFCGATFAVGVIGYFFGRESARSATKSLADARAFYTRAVAEARVEREKAVEEARAYYRKVQASKGEGALQ